MIHRNCAIQQVLKAYTFMVVTEHLLSLLSLTCQCHPQSYRHLFHVVAAQEVIHVVYQLFKPRCSNSRPSP